MRSSGSHDLRHGPRGGSLRRVSGQIVWHQARRGSVDPTVPSNAVRHAFDIASLTKVVATTSLLLLAPRVSAISMLPCNISIRRHAGPLSSTTVRQRSRTLAASQPGLLSIRRCPCWPWCHTDASAPARRHQAIQNSPGARRLSSRAQTLYSDLGFILLLILWNATSSHSPGFC
jgi:hypothetical protein